MFQEQCDKLFKELGSCKRMVLATSLQERVTARMMSVVIQNGAFYFQTDRTFQKYEQLTGNPNVALCVDNIQVEGVCRELGQPLACPEFRELFRLCFAGSYESYSGLENERAFEVRPRRIWRWVYEEGEAFIEVFDFTKQKYQKTLYKGQ